MKRAIVLAATLAPAALAELKDWLGIHTDGEDAALTALLRAALETCEAFTGTMPLEAECEEILAVSSDWQKLGTRPVTAIVSASGLVSDGTTTTALASTAYALEFRPDGTGWIRVTDPGLSSRVAVRFTAGMAGDWAALPDGLRQGVVRLAAHQYRQRENGDKSPVPPASVAALWRPWRGLRLL